VYSNLLSIGFNVCPVPGIFKGSLGVHTKVGQHPLKALSVMVPKEWVGPVLHFGRPLKSGRAVGARSKE
jgi:hypothetical protein